jgi:hypothetical protein
MVASMAYPEWFWDTILAGMAIGISAAYAAREKT